MGDAEEQDMGVPPSGSGHQPMPRAPSRLARALPALLWPGSLIVAFGPLVAGGWREGALTFVAGAGLMLAALMARTYNTGRERARAMIAEAREPDEASYRALAEWAQRAPITGE